MVVIVGRTEYRRGFAWQQAIKKALFADGVRQKLASAVKTVRMLIQGLTVGDGRLLKGFGIQPQTLNHTVNRVKCWPGNVVGVDLIAAHHQKVRTFVGRQAFDVLVGGHQCVFSKMMWIATRTMQYMIGFARKPQRKTSFSLIKQVRITLTYRAILGHQFVLIKRFKCEMVFNLHLAYPSVFANLVALRVGKWMTYQRSSRIGSE